MKMQIVGISKTEFKPKDSNDVIKGFNLFVTYPRESVEGYAAERIFLSLNRAAGYVPEVGDHIELSYNRYGKVESVVNLD